MIPPGPPSTNGIQAEHNPHPRAGAKETDTTMGWIRARQMQLLLSHIDRLPEPDRRAVHERIRLTAPDTLEDRLTVTDPKALTKPWETVKIYRKAKPPNDELREFACAEGIGDTK